ncbi:MAG TPA: MBL fold metallo-hydrolase [Marmoricola sp.]|jgi:glyoxylase-like metal-dependent hydrolase (beta-lactamase superfamily II)|nr:MBL fold metallo-hydrolase [Marmoricola sp.]
MKPVQVADGVFFCHTPLVNWVLVKDGDAVTLVDTGYPGQADLVVRSLLDIGSTPASLAAILVTHAHVDHVGSAERLSNEHGVPVYVHDAELAHARREAHHAATPVDVLRNAWRPGVLPWLLAATRVGVTSQQGISAPASFPGSGRLDLPGGPVPVLTAGHTPGHTVFQLPDHGIVITGDALVTGHPTSRTAGPQLLVPWFDDDRAETVRALDVIGSLGGELVLPGHGEPHHGSVANAARVAQSRVRSTSTS